MNSTAALHPGLTWASYLASLVAEQGSLSAVARSVSQTCSAEVESIERGLRRLRNRTHEDGGLHGARLLRCFGLPKDLDARLRWMGQYHSRFSDLPVAVCFEVLQVWAVPPISESTARVWLQLGLATTQLRLGNLEAAEAHLRAARQVFKAPLIAQLELELTEAFVASKRHQPDVATRLDRVGSLLTRAPDDDDVAALTARWLDQAAYQVLHQPNPALAQAAQLYARISTRTPFTACKRAAGLAYVAHRQGDRRTALTQARLAVSEAGDGGYTRLRLMALMLQATIEGPTRGAPLRARALRAARALGDLELVTRFTAATP